MWSCHVIRQMAKHLTVNRKKCINFTINSPMSKPISAVKCLRGPESSVEARKALLKTILKTSS